MKEGYKMSKLGLIPANWEIKTSVDIGLDFIDGDRGVNYPKSEDFSEEGYCLFLSAKNITKKGFKLNERKFISEKKDKSLRKGKLSRLDIIITTRGSVGHIALYDNTIPYENIRLNSGMVILRDSKEKFNKPYLLQLLKSKIVSKQIELISSGSAQPQLTIKGLNKLKLILAPKKEQKKIAKILSTVDEKIAVIDEQLQATQALKKGLMQRLLTKGIGHTTFKDSVLGEIPTEWEVVNIEHVANICTGGKDTQDKIESGKYPFFVRSNTIERINSYSFDGEAVLTSGDGVGVGKIFHYLNCKFDYHQRVYNIHNFSERLFGKFFYFYFSQHFYPRVMRLSAKNSVDSVRKNMITEMKIPLPSINEQQKIAKILSKVDEKIQILKDKKAQYQTLKRGLMQNLLTGKIRVKTST